MMKNNSIYNITGALLLAGALLVGCTDDSANESKAPNALTIEASIGSPTRVAYNGDAANFAQGDQISLYAWMGSATEVAEHKVVNGVVNTYDGTKWTPAKQMLWSYIKENHYFLGVYPAKTITNFTADSYTLGPDLMIATELDGIAFKEDPNPVQLNFTHVMAKLNVNLRFRNQWTEKPTVTSVATTAKNAFNVNYLTKVVTATGSNTQVPVQPLSVAATGHDKSFSGLQVPQEGVTTVTVIIDGKSYIFNAQEPISLESGKVTTLNLYVGRDTIGLASVTVAPWALVNIEGGEALIPATEITFEGGNSGSVNVNSTLKLTPIFYPETATDVDCTWTSQNPEVATVDENGVVTGVTAGETIIECKTQSVLATFTITVVP